MQFIIINVIGKHTLNKEKLVATSLLVSKDQYNAGIQWRWWVGRLMKYFILPNETVYTSLSYTKNWNCLWVCMFRSRRTPSVSHKLCMILPWNQGRTLGRKSIKRNKYLGFETQWGRFLKSESNHDKLMVRYKNCFGGRITETEITNWRKSPGFDLRWRCFLYLEN